MKITREQREAWATSTANSAFNLWMNGKVRRHAGTLDLEALYDLALKSGAAGPGSTHPTNPLPKDSWHETRDSRCETRSLQKHNRSGDPRRVVKNQPPMKSVRNFLRKPQLIHQCALGEADASPEQVKATLRTMEGVNWKMEREPNR